MKDNFDYLGELVRMCQSCDDFCEGCPFNNSPTRCSGSPSSIIENDNLENVKSLIKEWSEKHPIKTRSTEFKKMYPNVKVDEDGYPTICPNELDRTFKGACDGSLVSIMQCEKCRQDYWGEEVKCSE